MRIDRCPKLTLERAKAEALGRMELWRGRQSEAPRYEETMLRRERDWIASERPANLEVPA